MTTPPALALHRNLHLWKWCLAYTVVAAALFLLLAALVSHPSPLVRWDGRVIDAVTDPIRGHPLTIDVLRAITALGGRLLLYIGVAIVVLWQLRYRNVGAVVFLVATTVIGNAMNLALKGTFERARPALDEALANVSGFSYPSGHAMNSVVGYGAFLLVALAYIPRRVRPLVIAATSCLVLVIGGTRVALGVHFPTDVVGGFLAGSSWLALCYAVYSRARSTEE